MNALANHISPPVRYRVGLCSVMRPDENVKEMMGYYLQCYLIALGRKNQKDPVTPFSYRTVDNRPSDATGITSWGQMGLD